MIASHEQKVCTPNRYKARLYGNVIQSITLLILAGALLLLSSCSSGEVVPAFEGGPQILFDQDFIDLGKATPDQKMHAEFTFQNIGDAELILYDLTKETLEGC